MPVIQREMAGGQRLVDVRFSFLNFRQIDTDRVDLAASIDDSPTEFGLAVHGVPGSVVLTGDTRLVSRANVDRLGRMHRAVLEAMVADIDGDASVTLLPDEERLQLLVEWNDTGTAAGSGGCLPELFEAQVRRVPEAAAAFAGAAVSYAELDALANRFAHRLRASGVGPESVVGVLLDRGPDLLACLLGVWKAGGAYLPLDPSYPADRLDYMLADAGARVVVTQSGHADRFAADRVDERILVDRDRASIEAQPATAPARVDDPDRTAYVIYTSGSTGRPKGVQVTHRGLGNHVSWAAEVLASRGSTGAPLFSSVAFDLVVPNLWAPLVTGQPVHLLPADLDLADLGQSLVDSGPFSFIKLTPGHLDLLSRQLDDEQAAALAAVIVVAGEALPGKAADRWLRLLGPGRLINEYGPTEASVGTSIFPIVEPARTEIVPIGRPLPNMTMYVLDAQMQPVPIGVLGELYVGGTGVARGYTGKPVLTAERFLPDPFGPPGARLYRTGDAVRMGPDGAVAFAGRVDDQIKMRGYRIEPGEIRSVLLDHAGVRDAVVIAHDYGAEDRQLVAYCVAMADGPLSADELARHCATRLPDYMVPAVFVPLERIPLNANGKVDRAALPAPERAAAPGATTGPQTPLQEQIAQVWCSVLDRDRVGIHDNFFDLGGHSIRAVALVGALRAAGLDVSVRDVFEHRTVAALAAALATQSGPVEDTGPVAPFELISAEDRVRVPDGVLDAYPLSEVQRGMVVEMLADEALSPYHNTTSFLLRDEHPFSLPALLEATRIAVQRHEMLRTSFDLTGYSVPMQLVHATAEPAVTMVDLRGLDGGEQESALRRFIARERAATFDLHTPPLLRMTALIQSDRRWRLSFTQLHAITEGWSFHSLLMELLDRYHRIRDGLRLEVAELGPVRYADFIAAEQRSLASTEDREYWRGIVERYPTLSLPAGWRADPGLPREDFQVNVWHGDLEADLRALATRARSSLKSVLHAAHLKVMSMVTHEPVFASGLVCNARPELQGADGVYGMHLNSLPFAFERTAGTWLELVEQVFAREVQLWPHRRFPMPAIQREMAAGRRLVDVLFTFQDFHQVDTDMVDTEAGAGDDSTEFALGVPCTPQFIGLRTNTHVMTRENAQRLADMYRAVLVAMAADPDGDARETVLPADERARLLALATGAGRPAAATRCLHEMFEAQVAARPDAVAVVYERARLTFAEVNAAANRLAHRLRGLGVGPESVVGVCLEPGLDLVPTLLGVLKAGGAYLPVPPAYPADRLDYMLSDTAAPVVVTRKEHAGVLTGFGGVVIVLDEDTDTLAGQPSTDPHPASSPDNLAYVIYTSGSTGRPKGVGVTHGNVSRLFAATADQMLTGPDEAWALLHSYAFDASVWEIWGALLHGGRVVVVPQAVAQAPEELLTLLERQRVTVIGLSPVAFRAVVAAAGGDTARLSRLALRAITFGGDRLEAADIAEWVASQGLPRTALGQAYGPTEATVHVTYHRLGTGDLETADGIPIGRPIDDMRAYVLDTDGGLAPAGVPGELCAGGAGIARGYVGRPDLTAERFVPDPYGPPGSRYYRTGDLVRMRPDGNLDFLGRTDEQIKVRGYRIEPGEIQAVLVDHPAVREAVVTAHGAASSDRRLVAYCVPAAGALPASAELAAYCAARLPDYMVPVAFVSMARVPLTGSGKLDQRALPVPDRSSLWASQEYVAPSTPTEQRLTDIWSRVLGVERVGVTDRFFDIGGDSVTVLRAMSAAREIGLPLSVRMLYQYGSIAEVAGAIDSAMAGPGDGHVTGELPLTPIQHMVLDRAAGYPHDHRQAWLAFASGVDADALEASLAALTAHHEALRVRLVRGDSGPRWAIATAETARLLQRVDLSTLPEERRAVAAEDAVAGAYQRLDPESGPVISAVLLHAGAGEPDRLVVAAHEFVMDTESWAVLLSDLDTAYRQVAAGQEVALPPASGTLRRWAVGLADAATSGELTEQAPYWLNRAPVPASPADRPAGMNTVASERTVESTIQAAHGYPPEVLIAALAVVLARWTGGDRVLLDVEARRERGGVDAADLTRVAGPFAHRYPLALWLPPRREPAAVLRSVGDQLRMVPAGGTGYGLLRQLPADRDVAGALAELPAAAVRFRFAAGCGPQSTFDIDKLVTVRDPLAAREHVLEVDAVREPDRLTVSWTYSAAVHDEATVRRLVEEYPVELRRLAAVMAPDAGAVRSPGVLPSPLPTMAGHHVPGVSVAVMQGGELVSRQAYGVLDAREAEPVTIDSLFRVASVSKHISALGALRLVADGWLDLDEDINSYLVSWQVPYPDARSPVTLRELLANTAGLSREPEYEPYRHDGPVPTALDALHGRAPARTPAIVQLRPSGAFEKNRVNYLVLEQLMVDLTGVPFPELMRALVFEPLGMATSSYDPAYHRSSGRPVARGHDALGVPVPELGPAHPAAAAGGLWTTAGDLARAELEIRRAYLGQPALITQSLARQMMTPTAETLYGLSTIVDFQGTDLDFGIVGEFTGYWAAAMCRASSGDGFVLLTNGDSGREIAEFVIGATGGSTQLGRA